MNDLALGLLNWVFLVVISTGSLQKVSRKESDDGITVLKELQLASLSGCFEQKHNSSCLNEYQTALKGHTKFFIYYWIHRIIKMCLCICLQIIPPPPPPPAITIWQLCHHLSNPNLLVRKK